MADVLPGKSGDMMQVHPVERRLIEYIRGLQYGRLEVKVHQGLPVEIEMAVRKIRLEDIDSR